MGDTEAVLSEQECQCSLQWAWAVGVELGNGYGAGHRDVVIPDGQGASFRFVCSFIAHFSPFLPTLIILVDLFSLFVFLTRFFECFLILQLLQ
jgi:hypothetical protein